MIRFPASCLFLCWIFCDSMRLSTAEIWQIDKSQPDDEGNYDVEFTSSYGATETSHYDALGRCWVEEEQETQDNSNVTKNESFSQFGLPERTISSNGLLEIIKDYTYTEDGNYVESQTDVNGVTTEYDFDRNSGRLLSQKDAQGNTENYVYDAIGSLRRISQTVNGLSNGDEIFNEYTYENDRLKEIKHNGYIYSFEYDAFGNVTVAKIDGQTAITTSYVPDGRGFINEITYANGGKICYSYENNNITAIAYGNGSAAYTYDYGEDGTLLSCTDKISGRYTKYSGQNVEVYITAVAGIEGISENTLVYSSEMQEDGIISENFYGTQLLRSKQTSEKNSESHETRNASRFEIGERQGEIFLTQDEFGRPINRGLLRPDGSGIENQYVYRNISDTQTTWQINKQTTQVLDANNQSQTLLDTDISYDNRGNISEISSGNEILVRYKYDGVNQLIREDNKQFNRSVTYTYDVGGNITARKYYAFTLAENLSNPNKTVAFTYDKDKLISANDGSKTVNYQYDALGNPLNLGSSLWTLGNGSEFEDARLTWRGKQLTAIKTDEVDTILGELGDSPDIQYEYNENGLRSRKIISSDLLNASYEYVWNGTQLVGYAIYQSDAEPSWVRILYDDNGEALGYMHGMEGEVAEILWFIKNLLGDTVGLYSDTKNEQVVTFHYDAWGNVSMQNAGANDGELDEEGQEYALITPLFYRGYMYDVETGFYYLQSRYYSPYLCRFISPDRYFDTGTSLLGTNRYAYCDNNSVMYIDPTGEASLGAWLLGGILFVTNEVGAVFKQVGNVVSTFLDNPIDFAISVVAIAAFPFIWAWNGVKNIFTFSGSGGGSWGGGGGYSPGPSYPTETIDLGVGETYTASVGEAVYWETPDTRYVHVNASSGLITALAETGYCLVRAVRHSDGLVVKHIRITIHPRPTSVKFIEGTVTKASIPNYGAYISVGEVINFDSIFYDASGKVTRANKRDYRIKSVTVSGMLQQNPTLTGKNTNNSWFKGLKTGTATIEFTSYSSSLTQTFQIHVVNYPTVNNFKIDNAKNFTTADTTYNFNIDPVEFMCLEWTSSNTNVLEVTNRRNGLVKVKGTGTAIIKVFYRPQGGLSHWGHEVRVTVSAPTVAVTGVSLNPSGSVTFSINSSSYKIVATVSPSNATNKTVTWRSSNTAVATVNSSGNVTPKGVGTATITASSNNGKTASCSITVMSANNFQLFLDGREFGTGSDTYRILNNLNGRNQIFSSVANEVRLMAREGTPTEFAQNRIANFLVGAAKNKKAYWDAQLEMN